MNQSEFLVWSTEVTAARSSDATRPAGIPAMYQRGALRCILGPADDGSVGIAFDPEGWPSGHTVRMRIPPHQVQWLVDTCTQRHRSHSERSIGMPSFDVSIGGVVENVPPTARSSAACQACS